MAYLLFSLYEVLKVHMHFSLAASAASGAEGIRTPDPLLARQVLSQLSYNPLGLFIWPVPYPDQWA